MKMLVCSSSIRLFAYLDPSFISAQRGSLFF